MRPCSRALDRPSRIAPTLSRGGLALLVVGMTHFLALAGPGPARAAEAAPTSPPEPAASLELAGSALAEGRLDEARTRFEALAVDANLAPFFQALAILGLGETARAVGDRSGAGAAWTRLAEGVAFPGAFRDAARRKLRAIESPGSAGENDACVPPRLRLADPPEPARVFFVAAGGPVDADGSEARPFPSLERARDAVRTFRASSGGSPPRGGIRIVLRGPLPRVERALRLSAEDSGTAESPIIWEGRDGALLTGGVRLERWTPIADPRIREVLDPSVRDLVVEADLGSLRAIDLGDPVNLRLAPELFADGEPQTLAQWPNQGFVKTGEPLGKETFQVWGTIPGTKDGKFRYLEDRQSRWIDEPDVRLHGYWFWDWYEEMQKVASIDPAERTITLAQPWSQYGYRKDQRYRAINVLRELDAPGEWYLDRRTRRLYWLPPQGVDPAKSAMTLSILAEPFFILDGASWVTIRGISFEDARGDGIHIVGGSDCLAAGLRLRRLGGDGMVVRGSRHSVFGCLVEIIGCSGSRVEGGSATTLERGECQVENCTIRRVGRLKRTYSPAVLLEGCGNRVARNLFERIPSSALRLEGNDHRVELNDIRNVVEESDDQGGIDIFGNPLYRGISIRWNRWTDIVGGTHCGAAGVRLDDMISGVAVQGNIFERCGSVLFGGVQIHGGKENVVDGNVFIDCGAGVSFSRWGDARWLQGIAGFLDRASSPPHSVRYPELARIREEADLNGVARNVFVRTGQVFLRDGGTQRTALNAILDARIESAIIADSPAADVDPRLRRILFDPIPVAEIGPYPHSWKAEAASPEPKSPVSIGGERKTWHAVTLEIAGPHAHERDMDPNPFTDYRLSVAFEHESGGPNYRVQGHFAADGRAAETSAEEGTVWRCRFTPDRAGLWRYSVSFVRGKGVALAPALAGEPVGPADGTRGEFRVLASDAAGRDFRAKGRLIHGDSRYPRFAGTGERFLKAGADSPENFLAYHEFDGTRSLRRSAGSRPGEASSAGLHKYEAHARDALPGDPTWKDGRGKCILGALHYLASKGVNAVSFLPYNAGGDGDDVWPFVEPGEKFHYDVSKLDQWGIVFDHAQRLGIFLHFKLQETENDDNRGAKGVSRVPASLDGGRLGPERKLYLRELVSRFAHSLALNWNLGEENTQSVDEQRDMAQWIRDMDPYDHLIVVHTFPDWQDKVYPKLLGKRSVLGGASLQNAWNVAHARTLHWVLASEAEGRPWAIANDEQNPPDLGVPPDPGYQGFDGRARVEADEPGYDLHDIRKQTLWGTLMAGGWGVEYYFGYRLPQNDLGCEDWRSRDRSWDYCRIALEFFQGTGIPFWDMRPSDGLLGAGGGPAPRYCLSKPGEIYVVYLGGGGSTDLDLGPAATAYRVEWFDPRSGGRLEKGSIADACGPGKAALGLPPSDPEEDWVVLVRRKGT